MRKFHPLRIRYRSKHGFDLFEENITFSKTYHEPLQVVREWIDNHHLHNYDRVLIPISYEETEISVKSDYCKN